VLLIPRNHPVPATTTAAPWIETHANTLSLDWNGATLRVDKETRVRLDSARVATLERGAVYYDGTHSGIAIQTALGEIRDIGTQFEARLSDGLLRVRVREGRILLRGTIAEAATELVANSQTVTKNAIAVSGAEWRWIEEAAPPLRLEGLTLSEAIGRVAREKGLRVELRGVDGNARLHGSVDFTPDEALDAATAATSSSYRIENGTLIVRRR
jgi:ferric-dicitrate binding protein FerR (iron transport regulator)